MVEALTSSTILERAMAGINPDYRRDMHLCHRIGELSAQLDDALGRERRLKEAMRKMRTAVYRPGMARAVDSVKSLIADCEFLIDREERDE